MYDVNRIDDLERKRRVSAMVTFDASNSHFEYMNVLRHWSPSSEKYAGGDAVVTLLTCEDWKIGETIFYEQYWCAAARR